MIAIIVLPAFDSHANYLLAPRQYDQDTGSKKMGKGNGTKARHASESVTIELRKREAAEESHKVTA